MALLDPTFNEELEKLNIYAFIVVMVRIPLFTKQIQSVLYDFVQGVSGTGKTTLGSALAKELDIPYVEGDDLHPSSNIEKMSSGHPLTDYDREPWLKLIRTTAEHMTVDEVQTQSTAKANTGERNLNGRGVVISCSALKRCYRDILRGLGQQEGQLSTPIENSQLEKSKPILKTLFVYIEGRRDVLMDRMTKRTDHFMKTSMLDSQLETLEQPTDEEGVVVVSLTDSNEDQVRMAQQGLRIVLNMGTVN